MNFLSNDQKATIARLARQAYDSWEGREGFEECNPGLSVSKCFEAWRRCEQGKAVGRQSLTQCTGDDFLPLVAHFQNFAGRGAAAVKTLLRHAEAARITPFFKLQKALAQRGLDEGYAAAICRRQFKCALGDASEKQLWSLFYTIRNRRKVAAPARQRPVPQRVKENLGTLSVEKLRHRLAAAVQAENYEQAATLRDQIAAHTASADPY
jgi:hypothetical protein